MISTASPNLATWAVASKPNAGPAAVRRPACRCRAPGSRGRRSPRRAPAPSSRTAPATDSACRRSAARSRSSSSPPRAPSGSSSTPRSRARRRPRTCPPRAPRRRARARGSPAIAASCGRPRARSGRRGRSGASSGGHHAADGNGGGSRVSNRRPRTRVTRLQDLCDLGAAPLRRQNRGVEYEPVLRGETMPGAGRRERVDAWLCPHASLARRRPGRAPRRTRPVVDPGTLPRAFGTTG